MTYSQQLAAIAAAADAEIASLTATVALRDATIAALRAAAAPAQPGPSVAASSVVGSKAWRQVWGDEFTTDGPPDPAKWNTGRWTPTTPGDAPFNNAAEGAYLASSQVAVVGGQLVITTAAKPKTLNGTTYPTASGLIQSNGKWSLTPGGYVEARVLVPNAAHCWPAMWLLPSPSGWPPEIDVFEFFDSARPAFNYHPAKGGQSGPTALGTAGTEYRGTWHTYGLHWATTGTLTVYLDGVPQTAAMADTTLPHYLLLNLDTYAGAQPPAGTQMRVDWVRAWSPA